MQHVEQSVGSGSSASSVCGGSAKPIRLTADQMRMLDWVAAGHSYEEIAQMKAVQLNTVKVLIYRLAKKLGVTGNGRGHIRRWCARNGWDVAEQAR